MGSDCTSSSSLLTCCFFIYFYAHRAKFIDFCSAFYYRLCANAYIAANILESLQLLSEISLDSDFCHNYLHTPVTLNWLPYA